MNTPFRTFLVCLTVTCVTVAATSNPAKRLTPPRIAELTAPSDAPSAKSYVVSISGLIRPPAYSKRPVRDPDSKAPVTAEVTLPAEKPEGIIEVIREFRFPVAFDPQDAARDGSTEAVTPLTPTEFETVNTGWTIQLKAKPHGKLVALYGVADYVDLDVIPGGYGPLSGPIYSKDGSVLSLNELLQPKFQTTSTRFHIFAVPGETYEVALHRGAKSQKHRISVRAE